MKQGNYEHRIVTHIDQAEKSQFDEMMSYYRARQAVVVREALRNFYQNVYLAEIKKEQRDKVFNIKR